ncbi:hypothetical protein OY671_012803, partial [Metschnikowia pulcherrima]
SPNCDARPRDAQVSSSVSHNISSPPGQFGGPEVAGSFSNTSDYASHPWLERSRGSRVSAHFFIRRDGRIVQFVSTEARAWHAGVSCWAGEEDINSCSIGIEIINRGHDWGYPDFPSRQIAAVIASCRGIMLRRGVPSHRVSAHSDV